MCGWPPQATTHLRIGPDQDPLLTSWNVGLGRATSWTSDAGDRWAAPWTGWDGYVEFWSRVVEDTFPRDRGGGVEAEVADGVLRVTVSGGSGGAFPDGSEATARITAPDLTAREVRLERVDGDTFAGEVRVDDAGTYAVGASVVDAAGAQVGGGTALTNVSYSAEYVPGAPDSPLLARVSESTGGRGEIAADAVFDPADLQAGRSRLALAGWFLLAAALLWPVAIAVSRLALRGSVVRTVGTAGRTSLSWLRSRVPALPGRPRAPRTRSSSSSRRAGPVPPRPARPARPDDSGLGRPSESEPEPEPAAPSAPGSLGALLASQRRRRGVSHDAAETPPEG